MPLIERRYAEALVGISEQNNAIEDYQREFQSIVEVFNNQQDFRFFLLNPEVSADVKKEIINKVFSGQVKKDIVNFLKLLIDKGRIKFLPVIFDEYIKLVDKKRSVLNMTISSSSELEDSQINLIKEKYMKKYGATSAKINVEIDKNLIGGVKVKIGDKVVDGSIKGRLESLKSLIVK